MINTSVIGAGLACVDLIHTHEYTKYDVGGTAANIASVLAQTETKVRLVTADYAGSIGEWFNNALKSRGIEQVCFAQKKKNPPFIIEYLDSESGEHRFSMKCPYCGTVLYHTDLPDKNHVIKSDITLKGSNLFFYDRFSDGIDHMIKDSKECWNWYEPNSARNFKHFIKAANTASIIKYSDDRISPGIENSLFRCVKGKKLQIIIVSMGENGVRYKLRKHDGCWNEWVSIKPNKKTRITDGCGAGDWFSAIFIHYLLKDYPYFTTNIDNNIIKHAADQALKVSRKKCNYVGSQGMLKDSNAIRWLNKYIQNSFREVSFEQDECFICRQCGEVITENFTFVSKSV